MRRSTASRAFASEIFSFGDHRVLAFEGRAAPSEHARELEACRALRRAVFIVEQGVPESLEWDGLDEAARHFLALERADDPQSALGTARLRRTPDYAKAERVAVRAAARRRGVGRALMLALEEQARREGFALLLLHAQVTAIPFYTSLGYAARGEVFLDAGIDHREMVKRIV